MEAMWPRDKSAGLKVQRLQSGSNPVVAIFSWPGGVLGCPKFRLFQCLFTLDLKRITDEVANRPYNA